MKMQGCTTSLKKNKITSGTREWADSNVNCIIGCHNNCRYCYAKIMAKRFGRRTEDTWKIMVVKKDVLRKNFKKRLGRVMFPSTHDIFDISPFKEACFTVLGKLLESGNDVLVTTKPRFAVIKEIIQKFGGYKDKMQFRFTITSIDDDNLEFWEPNAPSFEERLSSLRYAWEAAFKTSVSVEPFLDYDPTKLIKTTAPFVTESIWIGRMNYIARENLSDEDEFNYREIRRNYETRHLQVIYYKLYGHQKIRFKDSIKIQLSSIIPNTSMIELSPPKL